MINYDITTINLEGKARINLISKILAFAMTQLSDKTENNIENLKGHSLF